MDSLVAAAIHDAKNSLNALGVWLVQARRDFSARDHGAPSPALEHAMELTTKLTGQLVELLALYRAGDGTLRLAVEDHDLADFLADVMAELRSTSSPDGDITVESDCAAAPEIGDWAFDAYLVKFVLLDALRNAMRHAQKRVRFSLSRNAAGGEGGIRFSVEDDGGGFPADVLRNESAQDASQGTAMSASSSGLGLSFARLIAGRHAALSGQHGRLELANDGCGQGGARFSLILP